MDVELFGPSVAVSPIGEVWSKRGISGNFAHLGDLVKNPALSGGVLCLLECIVLVIWEIGFDRI